MKIGAIVLTLLMASVALSRPCAADDLAQTSEKPWVDPSKPYDWKTFHSAGISTSGQQDGGAIFILVRRDDKVADPPGGFSSIGNFGDEQVIALIGKAKVQMGNRRLVKTFDVDGFSVCEAAPTYLKCLTKGQINLIKTD